MRVHCESFILGREAGCLSPHVMEACLQADEQYHSLRPSHMSSPVKRIFSLHMITEHCLRAAERGIYPMLSFLNP